MYPAFKRRNTNKVKKKFLQPVERVTMFIAIFVHFFTCNLIVPNS